MSGPVLWQLNQVHKKALIEVLGVVLLYTFILWIFQDGFHGPGERSGKFEDSLHSPSFFSE